MELPALFGPFKFEVSAKRLNAKNLNKQIVRRFIQRLASIGQSFQRPAWDSHSLPTSLSMRS